MAPCEETRITRRYRPNTLVLETHFETRDGAAMLVDFMPLRSGNPAIVRLVIGTRGQVAMSTELILRFGYGAIVPWVTRAGATGAIDQRPCSGVPRSAAKQASESKRGQQNQSIEPSRETSAAVRQSPMIA